HVQCDYFRAPGAGHGWAQGPASKIARRSLMAADRQVDVSITLLRDIHVTTSAITNGVLEQHNGAFMASTPSGARIEVLTCTARRTRLDRLPLWDCVFNLNSASRPRLGRCSLVPSASGRGPRLLSHS
ncbi:unnamed protein product, partial [Mycena citricolor]